MISNFSKKNMFIVFALSASLVISGCTSNKNVLPADSSNVQQLITSEYSQDTRAILEELTSEYSDRLPASEHEANAAQWIVSTLKDIGYEPQEMAFEFEKKDENFKSKNIIVTKPGKSNKQIIVGAHYDSHNTGHGADDNGSGVAVTLEAAKVLKDKDTPYTIKFIFFGAEEIGSNGSKAYVKQMSQDDLENTMVMINLDSLIAGDKSYVYGTEGDDGKYRDWILKHSKDIGLNVITQTENSEGLAPGTTGDWSDHAPFKEAGVPYVYFEATNWDLGDLDGYTQVSKEFGSEGLIWHTEFDTIEYLDKTFPGRIDDRLNTFVTLLVDTLLNSDF